MQIFVSIKNEKKTPQKNKIIAQNGTFSNKIKF
jgi:hypothetical protein